MIEIRPNCLYSRGDLADLLRPSGVDADTFIARLKPRKVFRSLFLGEDILAAMRVAPALSERNADVDATSPSLPPSRKRKGSNEGLIGGVFKKERLRL